MNYQKPKCLKPLDADLETKGEPSDHLRQNTKECFKVKECTGQIENQRNPDTGDLGKVEIFHFYDMIRYIIFII